MIRPWFWGAALAAATLAAVPSAATAAFLVQYEMNGQPGDQAFTAPTLVASGLTGVNLTRGPGLTAVAGANSMNASGWDGPNANDYFVFGFDVTAPGTTVSVSSFFFATRSSNTGPGLLNVLYSVNGGAETLVQTVTQTGTNFSDTVFNLAAPVNVTSSFRIFVRSANNTSANGGTVGSAGTLRIGDYGPGGTGFQPITVNGTVTAVPEPSSLALCGVGLGVVFVAVRRRNRAEV